MLDLTREIADYLAQNFDFFSPPQRFNDLVLRTAKTISSSTAETELVDVILGAKQIARYEAALRKKQEQLEVETGVCSFEILGNGDIVGFSFPRSKDSPLMARVRQVAPKVGRVLQRLRNLTPDEFELLCKRVLDLMKGQETVKTQRSGDGGVDFGGWLQFPASFVGNEDDRFFQSGFRMLVVGQAKRYDPQNTIGVAYVRELVGSAMIFFYDQLAPWQSKFTISGLTLSTPILPLLMTTGTISSGALDLAKKCGVVTKDGSDVALFLAVEGVANSATVPSYAFDETLFNQWLQA